jgi:hypothetical protein
VLLFMSQAFFTPLGIRYGIIAASSVWDNRGLPVHNHQRAKRDKLSARSETNRLGPKARFRSQQNQGDPNSSHLPLFGSLAGYRKDVICRRDKPLRRSATAPR